ncbi:MAG: hypothetical protein Q8O83_02540 [bacterium]|nr:hypothetical protein [bacterium]
MATEMKTLFSWQAPEYLYYQKGGGWYAALGGLTLILLVLAYLLNNFLFGVLIIVSSFALALYGARRPKIVIFGITVQGLRIEDRLYPYENIKSFWVNDGPPRPKEMTIIFRKGIMPRLSVPLGNADPNEVRNTLIKYIREEQQEEAFADTLGRYLRF